MSDLAKWKVHGPVKTLKSEFATWDRDRQDWQATEHVTVASFHPDGTISNTDAHNPDGTIARSRWLRDDAGRTIEFHSWMNDGPIGRTVYVYDEGGRPIRTTHLSPDGTSTEVEVYNYDSDGKKTKVRFLPRNVADSECSTSGACGATTGYSIEGTDSAYGAPGATTIDHHLQRKEFTNESVVSRCKPSSAELRDSSARQRRKINQRGVSPG